MVDDAKETTSRLPRKAVLEQPGTERRGGSDEKASDEKASGERSNQDWAAPTFSVALEIDHRSATIPVAEFACFSA
jgi:hypothetical protein